MSDCGKYLIVSIVKACRDNLLYFADLEKNGDISGKIPLTPIVTEFKADYDVSEKKWMFTKSYSDGKLQF